MIIRKIVSNILKNELYTQQLEMAILENIFEKNFRILNLLTFLMLLNM
jgi:hypothetical protein